MTDLTDKPHQPEPPSPADLRQQVTQDAERVATSGAHDVPTVRGGALTLPLDAIAARGARLIREAKQRELSARLVGAINRSHVATGRNAAAVRPGEGEAALELSVQNADARTEQLEELRASARQQLVESGAPVPPHTGSMSLVVAVAPLVIVFALFPTFDGIMFWVVSQGYIGGFAATTGAMAFALVMMLLAHVGGATIRKRARAGADASTIWIWAPITLGIVLAAAIAISRYFDSTARAALRTVRQLRDSDAAAQVIEAAAQEAAKASATGEAILWFTIALVSALLLLAACYLLGHSSAVPRFTYIQAERALVRARSTQSRAVQDLATCRAQLLVCETDLELTRDMFDLEAREGIPTLVEELEQVFLNEFVLRSGEIEITESVHAWAVDYAEDLEREQTA